MNDDRVRRDPALPIVGTIGRPIAIIHRVPDGERIQFGIFVSEVDPTVSDPRLWGILISDMVDHVAHAYAQATGRDVRLVRETLLRTIKDEERFKQRDPSRGSMSGTIVTPTAKDESELR